MIAIERMAVVVYTLINDGIVVWINNVEDIVAFVDL
jgi:hypothetical protein